MIISQYFVPELIKMSFMERIALLKRKYFIQYALTLDVSTNLTRPTD